MCEVHLVPKIDEIRVAERTFKCGECKRAIGKKKEYRHIEGEADDGSGDEFVYRAHDDCYQLSILDVRDDGCFTYGGVKKLPSDHRGTGVSDPSVFE